MNSISSETQMAFFHEAVTDAFAHERLNVTELCEFYIVKLLAGERARASHPVDALHNLFAQAISEPPARRDELFREVGDRALIIAGLWWQYDLRSRRVPKSMALMRLGSSAYWTIGAEPFEELAKKFDEVVYALARLSADMTLSTSRDILRLYDAWERTGSPLAARALARRGVAASGSNATS